VAADASPSKRPTYQPTLLRWPPSIVITLSNTSATSDTTSYSASTVRPRVTLHTATAAAALSRVTNGATPVLVISEKSAP
jgi:hypothetical protein